MVTNSELLCYSSLTFYSGLQSSKSQFTILKITLMDEILFPNLRHLQEVYKNKHLFICVYNKLIHWFVAISRNLDIKRRRLFMYNSTGGNREWQDVHSNSVNKQKLSIMWLNISQYKNISRHFDFLVSCSAATNNNIPNFIKHN